MFTFWTEVEKPISIPFSLYSNFVVEEPTNARIFQVFFALNATSVFWLLGNFLNSESTFEWYPCLTKESIHHSLGVCVNGLRFNTRSISFEQMPPGEAWFQQDDCTLVHPVRPQGLSMWGPYTSSTSQKKRSYSVPKKRIWKLLVFCWTTQPRGKAVHHRSHQEWGFCRILSLNQHKSICRSKARLEIVLHTLCYYILVKAVTGFHMFLARFHVSGLTSNLVACWCRGPQILPEVTWVDALQSCEFDKFGP